MEVFLENFKINSEEITVIPTSLSEKLSFGLDNWHQEITVLKEVSERAKVDQEQLLCEYDAKLMEANDELKKLRTSVDKLEVNSKDLEEKYEKTCVEKDELRRKFEDVSMVQLELSKAVSNLEGERDHLTDQLARKLTEHDRMAVELSQLKAEADEVRRGKLELRFKLDDLQSKEKGYQLKEARFAEERKTYERQIAWLDEQLQEKTGQVATCRRDMAAKNLTLESELQTRTLELTHVRQTSEAQLITIEKLTKASENYIEKLKLSNEEQIKIEELYRNELDTQKRLVALYKEQADIAEKRGNDLHLAVTDMQTLLKSASDNLNQMESEKNELSEKLEVERRELEGTIARLSKELEGANHLLEKFRVRGMSEEELKALNPAAAATLSALKRNRSLTQIYTDYMQVTEERDLLMLDKQRLSDYMNQVLQELEEKGPGLQRQQEEFARSQASVHQLTSQLTAATDQLLNLQNETDELQRKSAYYQRENRRLKQTCQDLGRQVRVLLREIEVARGGLVRGGDDESFNSGDMSAVMETTVSSSSTPPPLGTNQVGSVSSLLRRIDASEVICEQLVTFRNICDLQAQNQRLIEVTRELGEKLEAREADNHGERLSELRTRVDELAEEVDRARRAAERSAQQLDITQRQRDMYRTLAEQRTGHDAAHHIFMATSGANVSPSQSARTRTCSATLDTEAPGDTSTSNNLASDVYGTEGGMSAAITRLEGTATCLRDLQTEFRRYREEKVESDKVYSQTIEQLRKENSEIKLLNSKMASQLDFTHEKYRVLESNIVNYKQEIQVLREVNQRHTGAVAKYESELAKQREELMARADRLATLEVETRTQRTQLDRLQTSERRLRDDLGTERKQAYLQQQLQSNLQAIQTSLEQRDTGERSGLVRRMEGLETDLAATRAELERERRLAGEQRAVLQEQIQIAKRQASELKAALQQRDQDVELAKQHLGEAQAQLQQQQLQTQQTSGNTSTITSATNVPSVTEQLEERICLLELRLRDTEQERDNLAQSQTRLQGQVEEYKSLASQMEGRLEEMVAQTKQLESELATKLAEEAQRVEFLQSQITLEQKECQTLMNENIRITEEAHAMNANLHRELAAAQHELAEAVQRRDEAMQLEAGAKAIVDRHQALAKEANEKYQRELLLHATDVAQLEVTKKELDALTEARDTHEEDLRAARTATAQARSQVQTQEQVWAQEKAELTARAEELKKQNSVFEEQVVKLSQHILTLKRLTDTGAGSSKPATPTTPATPGFEPCDSASEDVKTSEELLQVVSYMRRQKEIAETANEVSSREVSRLSSQLGCFERQLEEARARLDEERASSELAMETAKQHALLMSRLEQLNLVTESNRMLRQEREALQHSLQAAQAEVSELRSAMEPLRENLRQVTATRDASELERRSLEEERTRWRERCNKLIESAERMDPEQYKKACTERDELQRALRRKEEDMQQTGTVAADKLREEQARVQQLVQSISDQDTVIRDLRESLNTVQEKQKSDEETLKQRDTTVEQLRVLARKYKAESQVLREKSVDQEQLKEELTKTKADLIDSRASMVRFQDEMAALRQQTEGLESVLADHTTSGELGTGGNLSEQCRSLVTRLHSDSARLRESEREKDLRNQMLEHRLAKLMRDNSDLRDKVAHYQSGAGAAAGVQQGQEVPSQVLDMQEGVCIQQLQASETVSTADQTTTSGPLQLGPDTITPSSDTEMPSCPILVIHSAIPVRPLSAGGQVSQQIAPIRAAAVHPVPTSTVSPSGSVASAGVAGLVGGPRQTAEIRPMPSVATVMPTPAPHDASGNDATNVTVSPPQLSHVPLTSVVSAASVFTLVTPGELPVPSPEQALPVTVTGTPIITVLPATTTTDDQASTSTSSATLSHTFVAAAQPLRAAVTAGKRRREEGGVIISEQGTEVEEARGPAAGQSEPKRMRPAAAASVHWPGLFATTSGNSSLSATMLPTSVVCGFATEQGSVDLSSDPAMDTPDRQQQHRQLEDEENQLAAAELPSSTEVVSSTPADQDQEQAGDQVNVSRTSSSSMEASTASSTSTDGRRGEATAATADSETADDRVDDDRESMAYEGAEEEEDDNELEGDEDQEEELEDEAEGTEEEEANDEEEVESEFEEEEEEGDDEDGRGDYSEEEDVHDEGEVIELSSDSDGADALGGNTQATSPSSGTVLTITATGVGRAVGGRRVEVVADPVISAAGSPSPAQQQPQLQQPPRQKIQPIVWETPGPSSRAVASVTSMTGAVEITPTSTVHSDSPTAVPLGTVTSRPGTSAGPIRPAIMLARRKLWCSGTHVPTVGRGGRGGHPPVARRGSKQ